MVSHWQRKLLLALLVALLTVVLPAQSLWHKETMLAFNGKPLTRLKGIAIPAEAEYNGRKFKAYVFFSGYDGRAGGSGYPLLGIHIENLKHLLSESEIERFSGPDLSQYAMKSDAIRIRLRKGGKMLEFNTRLLWNDGSFFNPGFDSDGYFSTNPRNTKAEISAWSRFLTDMSEGFDAGTAVVGGKAFSNELTVRFSGAGLDMQLKELLAYCQAK